MEKLLVSACLAGEKTRYDGKDNAMPDLIDRLANYYDLIFVCPENMGGLPTPRDPSEIKFGTIVVSSKGKDVTSYFVKGASEALRICQFFGIRFAVLKEGSPSCGVSQIHDGSFSNKKIAGMGFTARKLIEAGIKVFSEETAEELLEGLARRDQSRAERDRIRQARTDNEAREQQEQSRPSRPHDGPREKAPRKSYGDRPRRNEERFPKDKRGENGGKPGFKGKGGRFQRSDRSTQGERNPRGERKPRFKKKDN